MSPYWKITGGLDFHKWVLKIGALGVSKQCAIHLSAPHGHFTVTSRTVPMLPEVLYLVPFRLCRPGICLHLCSTCREDYRDCKGARGSADLKEHARELCWTRGHLLQKTEEEESICFCTLRNTAGNILISI